MVNNIELECVKIVVFAIQHIFSKLFEFNPFLPFRQPSQFKLQANVQHLTVISSIRFHFISSMYECMCMFIIELLSQKS